MIRLAVIAGSGIHKAVDWTISYAVENGEAIKEVSIARATITTNKKEYKIILHPSDLNGAEFNGYLICPTYEDLVALVRERVRLEEASNV